MERLLTIVNGINAYCDADSNMLKLKIQGSIGSKSWELMINIEKIKKNELLLLFVVSSSEIKFWFLISGKCYI